MSEVVHAASKLRNETGDDVGYYFCYERVYIAFGNVIAHLRLFLGSLSLPFLSFVIFLVPLRLLLELRVTMSNHIQFYSFPQPHNTILDLTRPHYSVQYVNSERNGFVRFINLSVHNLEQMRQTRRLSEVELEESKKIT
jgi:hypothetical protein